MTTTNKSNIHSELDSDLQSSRHTLIALQFDNRQRFGSNGKSSDAGVVHSLECAEWALHLLARLEASGALDTLSDRDNDIWGIVKFHAKKSKSVVTSKIKANISEAFKEVKGYRA